MFTNPLEALRALWSLTVVDVILEAKRTEMPLMRRGERNAKWMWTVSHFTTTENSANNTLHMKNAGDMHVSMQC